MSATPGPPQAQATSLVTTAWLAERLGDPDLQVIDASWFMPGENRSAAQEYDRLHIPGAVFFDIEVFADPDTDLPHMAPEPAAFASAAARFGLRRDATVVAYDSLGIRSSARAWWTLRLMGFPDARVLDGGLPRWCAEQRPLSDEPAAFPPTTLCADFRPDLVLDLPALRRGLETRRLQVVDARSGARFRGEAAEPRPGLRSGHMPGALNVPWTDLVSLDGQLHPASQLKTIFEAAGLRLNRPIAATCGSGVTASVIALALAQLGLQQVAVYDGSWAEWGAHPDAPVATGP